MTNLLVTGAAGFIGSHFIDELEKNPVSDIKKIYVLDALSYSGRKENLEKHIKSGFITFILGDIADRNLVQELVTREKINSIINFAAETHVDRSISEATPFVLSNVLGVTNLLEVFRRFCHGTFIQVSTDEVYGSIEDGSWTEYEPLSPNSPYAASKASGDLMAIAFHRTFGLDIRITRCSNNYGPRQFPEKIIPLFISNLIDGKKVPLYGDGKNVRDWIHVSDHCRAVNLVFRSGKPGEIYNIGGDSVLSNMNLTKKILAQFHLDDSHIKFVEDRKGHDFRYSVDSRKVKHELGFLPKISFEEGLSSTISWYMENENWWRPLIGEVTGN